MLIDEIKQLAHDIHAEVIGNRRSLHANPELSFLEYKTSAFVKRRLEEMGIPWQEMAGTGIVANIKGDQPSGRTIVLRADMDALPITESNTIDYISTTTGVMHACGHDAHTASLLGTAFILRSLRNRFAGTVRLIFQPGEEKLPGGASLMIKEGALKDMQAPGIMRPLGDMRPLGNVQRLGVMQPLKEIEPLGEIQLLGVIGQHCMPALATGKVAFRKGPFMASMDELRVIVKGRGGHGAMPHHNIDPVLISAHLIVALQQLVSRSANPTVPTVLSFGKVIADGAINVIPDEVHLEGTFRTFDERWRTEAHTRMKNMAEGIAQSMGGSCTFNITRGYPVLVNESTLTGQATAFAEEYLGKEQVELADSWTAAEDFSYYSQAANSCFYLLGTGNPEKKTTSFLHTSTFNIDEAALALSTGLMAYIAIRRLEN